jgi:hypothetical protein
MAGFKNKCKKRILKIRSIVITLTITTKVERSDERCSGLVRENCVNLVI